MIDGHRVAVVMPMYNEARHVAEALANVPPLVDEIVVVDDGSSDGSATVVRAAGDRRVRLVSHPHRLGVGRALLSGFNEAIRRTPDLVVTMDSDGQMSGEDLPGLLKPLTSGAATYVKGNRFAPNISRHAMPLNRRLVNRLSSAYFSYFLVEPRLQDVQCGYTAMRLTATQMLVERGFHPSYGVYNDMLSRVLDTPGESVEYVPVAAVYGAEKSHLRVQDALRLGLLAIQIPLRSRARFVTRFRSDRRGSSARGTWRFRRKWVSRKSGSRPA